MKARFLWLFLGYGALGAGLLGVITPLLPTTPFLILAALAFARSAPALERRLLDHPRFGPAINRWRRHGAIERRAKLLSISAMAAALGISVLFGMGPNALMVQAVVIFGAAVFVLSRPSGPAASRKGDLCG